MRITVPQKSKMRTPSVFIINALLHVSVAIAATSDHCEITVVLCVAYIPVVELTLLYFSKQE